MPDSQDTVHILETTHSNDMPEMKNNRYGRTCLCRRSEKRSFSPLSLLAAPYQVGELYLFHPTDPLCPCDSSLWGVYDKTSDGILYLESSSWDLQEFDFWHALSLPYGYRRLSTRSELRDYMSSLFLYETTRPGSLQPRLFP